MAAWMMAESSSGRWIFESARGGGSRSDGEGEGLPSQLVHDSYTNIWMGTDSEVTRNGRGRSHGLACTVEFKVRFNQPCLQIGPDVSGYPARCSVSTAKRTTVIGRTCLSIE